jgi:hypothetical protein
VKRKCTAIAFSDTFNRHLCVDDKEQNAVFKFLAKNKSQFKTLTDRILEQRFPYYTNYKKLKYGYSNVSEMRFNVGSGNERIYCYETTNKFGELCVIMSRFYGKKTTDAIDKKIRPVLDAVENYGYEINYSEDED